MVRALVRLLPIEMAVLGVVELVLLFGLALAALITGQTPVSVNAADLTRDSLIPAAMLAVTVAGTAATIGLYRPAVCLDRRRLILTATTAAVLAFPAVLLVSGAWRAQPGVEHVWWLLQVLAVWLAFAVIVRACFAGFPAWMPVRRRVLIVGTGPEADGLRLRLSAGSRPFFEPVRVSTMAEAAGLDTAGLAPAGRFRAVLTSGLDNNAVRMVANPPASLAGVPVMSAAAFQERHLGRIEPDSVALDSRSFDSRRGGDAISACVKRAFDIVVSLALLVVTLPMMVMTAILVKLGSPGPILYRQERTGLHGVPFTLLKFRSMVANAEQAGEPRWAQRGDPRVTRVGAFIRAGRIDELPQLLNVLRGEMSMIGPRPERPLFVEQLSRAIPFFDRRSNVKPGLTGWAQVNFPYGASVEDAREKLAYDLYYVKHRGLLLDLVILFATVRVVLFREGAR